MNIGDNIRKIRKSKGLKQSELAKLSNVSRVAIGNYERGDRVPPINIAIKIADALDIELSELTKHEKQQINTIGENIKKVRELKNVSQDSLSKLSNMPRTSLGRYERGEREPKIGTVKLLAETLGVTVQELITGEKQKVKVIEKDISMFSTDELLNELRRRITEDKN